MELVKTETSHQVEEVEGEGVMTEYDESYGGQYEDPQYSDQYGLLEQDDSVQGWYQHHTPSYFLGIFTR